MAFDAIAVRCLTNEMNAVLHDARIDRISQPEKDEIVLNIRTRSDNYKLVLSASAAHPRVHFTVHTKKNPKTAPMFCMLLRKHLNGGKISEISQQDFERVIKFSIDGYDELGEPTTKHLFVEIMGRHSNIVLTDSEFKIIDCIKRIDQTMSSVRSLMPGLIYKSVPAQNKVPMTDFSNDTPIDLSPQKQADKVIMDTVSGISPVVSRELVYRAFKTTDVIASELNLNRASDLKMRLVHLADDIKCGRFSPCLIEDLSSGKYIDFSAVDIRQYENAARIKKFESMSALIDEFFYTRDMRERLRQKSAGLTRLVANHIERAAKKIDILNRTLQSAENGEKYKIQGDLITANIYKIQPKSTSVTVENYYDSGMTEISLDASLTPSQNAQRYYKKYRKSKTALTEAAKQLKIAEEELYYLESTLALIENSEDENEITAIRAELSAEGYITGARRQKKADTSKPRHFVSKDGFDIYVGKNNTQNDTLTLKFANSSDLWFHTKNIHGSHVVIKLSQNKDVPPDTVRYAAELAAYYSKARESSQVPVDYTRIKNVKKPSGAKPGMVIYTTYNTVYVTPKKPE